MKKEPEDRSKLKIASFRTTDGDWFDFSQAAESNGFTATDILKACMVDYQAGTYSPSVNTPVSMRLQSAQGLSADDVRSIAESTVKQAIDAMRNNLDDQGADLADLRERLTRLEASITNTKPKAATTTEPDSEVLKLAKRLEADPNGLQRSVRAGIAKGLGGKALCDFLFQNGHGANNGVKPFDNSVAGRLVKAIAHLDEG
jgi:hypothetical protein